MVASIASIRSARIEHVHITLHIRDLYELAGLPWRALDAQLAQLVSEQPWLIIVVTINNTQIRQIGTYRAFDEVTDYLQLLLARRTSVAIECVGTNSTEPVPVDWTTSPSGDTHTRRCHWPGVEARKLMNL